jgi:hypothetical protein
MKAVCCLVGMETAMAYYVHVQVFAECSKAKDGIVTDQKLIT